MKEVRRSRSKTLSISPNTQERGDRDIKPLLRPAKAAQALLRAVAPLPSEVLRNRYGRLCALSLAIACSLFASAADAARDRTAPSTPLNMRLTSVQAYAVSLAWDASTDNSGDLSYRIATSDGRTLSINQSSTTARIASGLVPGASYAFCVFAVDAAGNRSRGSSCVNTRLPLDTTPPSSPDLSVIHVGSNSVSLAFGAAADDGPQVSYELFMDGCIVRDAQTASTTVSSLAAASEHSFAVRAKDGAGNVSGLSRSLLVTLDDDTAGDVTPPSAPTGLTVVDGYCGDVLIYWIHSVDDRDSSSDLSYEVYVDGVLAENVIGERFANVVVASEGLHFFEVIAVDRAGNASTSAVISSEAGVCD